MESVCRLTPTVGSNPTLSAIVFARISSHDRNHLHHPEEFALGPQYYSLLCGANLDFCGCELGCQKVNDAQCQQVNGTCEQEKWHITARPRHDVTGRHLRQEAAYKLDALHDAIMLVLETIVGVSAYLRCITRSCLVHS